MKYYQLIGFCLMLMACGEKKNPIKKVQALPVDTIIQTPIRDSSKRNLEEGKVEMDTLEQKIVDAGLVDVQTYHSGIWVDLKYSTTDNFLSKDLYGSLTKAYLQKDLAERLAVVQDSLTAMDSSLHLLVYDAVRPRSVQWEMWRAMDSLPVAERVKFVSNPRNGSVHNYGCAVDLTICNADTIPL
ncbi:M15 family metallopeptidase, partial [Lishizhenia sp.]|uniref:M15 family metallopeptidase n=1 Tax=Lishizhenia sp. TaxID=2497594 RepID=UPI00299EB163